MERMCVGPPARARRFWLAAALATLAATGAAADRGPRFAEVIRIAGSDLALFDGCPVEQLAVLACVDTACHPIPFQIDKRDPQGLWVLDRGPEPTAGQPQQALDSKDVLLFMAGDAGDRARRADLPAAQPAAEISLRDPLTGSVRWVYLLAFSQDAPRSTVSYVHYDPATDRARGGHVCLGFDHGVPSYLSTSDTGTGADAGLLDRFKVRATATFLWGLIRVARNEDDLRTQFVAWREGPIRVIRRQRQWIRIGWGIRSPTFGSYTYFYRDFAELPVGLHLNFPPTYFFGNIVIRAFLDFRDLRGWSVLAPSLHAPLLIDGHMTPEKEALNQLTDAWFALLGPQITLVEDLELGPSLASVRRRLFYRESGPDSEPPEALPGEQPGIGYRLDRWEDVGAGAHQLASTSYALPDDVDVREFMAARAAPLQARVQALP
jgi:hypothetical protein